MSQLHESFITKYLFWKEITKVFCHESLELYDTYIATGLVDISAICLELLLTSDYSQTLPCLQEGVIYIYGKSLCGTSTALKFCGKSFLSL